MIEKINDLLKRVEEFKPQAAAEIEEFRVRLLGRKGQLNDILDEFKTVAPEMKRELGQKINTLKTRAIEKINALKTELENSENNTADSGAWIDMSRPAATILRQPPSDLIGQKRDRQHFCAPGLHGSRRP